MIEHLFELYNLLSKKEDTIRDVLEILGGEENNGFLIDEMTMVELLIVKAYGGNEGHFEHVSSTELFYKYGSTQTDYAKNNLIDYIKLTIENDWTDEVAITFIRE